MKIYKILMLLVGGLSITGCSDLVEEPVSLLSPDAVYQEVNDIQTGVNGAYAHAINEEVWGRKLSCSLMLRSDMVSLQSSQARRVEMENHTITTDNEMVYDPWRRMYLGIAAANSAIDGATRVEALPEVENPITAQAHFIRAFYYFHLVRLHGDVPYIEETISSDNKDELAQISSTSEADIYEKIIADLEYAEAWLPDVASSRDRPSKAAAQSYLALVYLTRAGVNGNDDFEKAYFYAKEVINNKKDYEVELDSDFQALFNANRIDSSKEPIFALDYNNNLAANNAYDQIAPMTGVRNDDDDAGWSVMVPSMAVYDSFDQDDYRTRVSFQTEASIGGKIVDYTNFTSGGHGDAADRPYIAKYTRYPGSYSRGNKRATSHNFSMMRYAEVLLIAAEAGVETGAADARDLLNEVRERAQNGGASTNGGYVETTIPANTSVPALYTGAITVEDVLEERRIELAFEGKRWYDIKRRQLGDVVFGTSGYEGAKGDWSSAVDYDTPLPEDEVLANGNIADIE